MRSGPTHHSSGPPSAAAEFKLGRPYKELREMLPEQIFQNSACGLVAATTGCASRSSRWASSASKTHSQSFRHRSIGVGRIRLLHRPGYNPTGIASAIAKGVDSPEMKFDNNTIASTLLGGWIYPAVIVEITVLGYRFWRARRRASNV